MWHSSTVRGSKHNLSDSEAGTEQSPACQGQQAVWLPWIMGGRGEGWLVGVETERKRGEAKAAERPQSATKPPLQPPLKTKLVGFAHVPMCSHQ